MIASDEDGDAIDEETRRFLSFPPEEADAAESLFGNESDAESEAGETPAPMTASEKKEAEELGSKALELCRIAGTAEHQFDHGVFNPFCEYCVNAAAQRKPRYKGTLAMGPKPTKFGEQTTGDHLISRNKEVKEFAGDEDDAFFPGAQNAVVMFDRATEDLEVYPVASRTKKTRLKRFKIGLGLKTKSNHFMLIMRLN